MMGNAKSLTLRDVYDTMDDKQKEATCAMVGLAYNEGYSEGYYEGRLDAAKLLKVAWGKELFNRKDIL